MDISKDKLDEFQEQIYDKTFLNNSGGMGIPDLFTLYLALNCLKPKIVVESGVWNGVSTKLIRKTLPEVNIICLDPREIPKYGYKDDNPKTTYYTGRSFKDFKDVDLSQYNSDEIFCFFDCHQSALDRLIQCRKKGVKHTFFNDNYPVNCGSHFTLEHFLNHDNRHFLPELHYGIEKCIELREYLEEYKIFPNIYPGSIKTGEGFFDCESYFDTDNSDYPLFKVERNKYRWNTYVKLKIEN